MSDPAMPRAPARLQSSNKISFDDPLSNEPRLGKLWGGVFFHPSFTGPAREILMLDGVSSYIIEDVIRVGALNLLWAKRSIFRAATLPLLFQYYGPILFEQLPSSSILESLDNYLEGIVDFAYLSFPPEIHSLDGLSLKWKTIPNVTLALTGTDLKRWGNDFKDDVKNKIKKATREKVEVCTADTLPQDLWLAAYARRGLGPPIEPMSLARWCRALVDASLLRIYTARIDGQDVSFRGELILGDFAYDWIAGSAPAFHASGANQLLMAEIGRQMSTLNLSAWDLIGGEIQSIADFKKSFGAREIPYLQASCSFGVKGKMFEKLRNIRHGRK